MKRENPWLFQRIVRFGFASPALPVYVFSDEACKQVAKLNKSINPRSLQDQIRMQELSPYPHDQFAIEMTCRVDDPDFFDDKMRTLTVVSNMPDTLKASVFVNPPQETMRGIIEFETFNGRTTILPIVFSFGQGTFVPITDIPNGRKFLEATYTYLRSKLPSLSDALRQKYNFRILHIDSLPSEIYKKRSAETIAFLNSSCAILASPVMKKEDAKRSGRAPPLPGDRKDRERIVETRWTHVDIDLDRQVSSSSDGAGESGRTGVALHPVRSHLRVTRHGISQVRAHMRGDVSYGVRHRIGQVHKSGH